MSDIKILSIDGGGVRGIIPTIILQYIREKIKIPMHKVFDIIAGTSTGGIIALGLTIPNCKGENRYEPKDLTRLYEKESKFIFKKNMFYGINGILDSLLRVGSEKYSIKNLEIVLEKYFNGRYISEALTDIIIPAYDIENKTPHFFKSSRAKRIDGRNELMYKVGCATSAAPTYFEPYKMKSGVYIDGGIFANNPAMCALADIYKKYGCNDNVTVLSLGTGYVPKYYNYNKVKKWGVIHWARPLIDITMSGQSQTVSYQMRQMVSHGGENYIRIQMVIPEELSEMDCIKEKNILMLKNEAYNYIEKNKEYLDLICEKLM